MAVIEPIYQSNDWTGVPGLVKKSGSKTTFHYKNSNNSDKTGRGFTALHSFQVKCKSAYNIKYTLTLRYC